MVGRSLSERGGYEMNLTLSAWGFYMVRESERVCLSQLDSVEIRFAAGVRSEGCRGVAFLGRA